MEVHQLDAAHHWLGKGYGLQDLKQETPLKVLGTRWWMSGCLYGGDHSCTPANGIDHAPQQERVVMALTTAVQQALQASTPAPPKDPLALSDAPGGIGQEVPTDQSVREGDPGLSQSTINVLRSIATGSITVGPGRWRGVPGGGRPRSGRSNLLRRSWVRRSLEGVLSLFPTELIWNDRRPTTYRGLRTLTQQHPCRRASLISG